MTKMIEERARSLPVIAECDVLVCGGGMAGCAAALAAARNGAMVALIDKSCCLGGLATVGLIAIFLPLCDGNGNQVIGGIAEEFFRAGIEFGPGKIPDCWLEGGDPALRAQQRLRAEFNPSWMMLSVEKKLVEAGVRLVFDTRLCAVDREGDRIRAAIVENKSGRCAILCKTAVDATGDADLCHFAGEETVSLDSNRRASWFYSLSHGRQALHIMGDIFFEPVPEGHRTFAGDNWEDVSAFMVDSRDIVREKILEARGKEGTEDLTPTALPGVPLMRRTRRLKGKAEIDEEFRFSGRNVGMTGYYRQQGLVVYFPYECLIGKAGNLFAAGRCISSREEYPWHITRGIPSCCITGQAAGTAAALCARDSVSAQDLDVGMLQDTLIAQGVRLRKTAP